MPEWVLTVDSAVAMEDYMHLAGHIWDYGFGVVDVGMTEEFAAFFVAHVVAWISDLVEMILAFDDDEDEQPKRLVRWREEGEEMEEGYGYDGGDDRGDGRGGGRGRWGDRGGDGGDRGRIRGGDGGRRGNGGRRGDRGGDGRGDGGEGGRIGLVR